MPYGAYLKLQGKARCIQSPIGLCRIKHPAQLLPKEATIIKTFCEDERYQYWPLSSVYYEIIRSQKAHFHISTFYKYVAAMNLKRRKPAHRRKHHHIGIRAEAPLQIIHADVTELRLHNNRKVYIYAIVDNCSRSILHLQAHEEKKALFMFNGLKAMYEEYLQLTGLTNCTLMTDDGSENYGEVKQLIAESNHPSITHIIAQTDVHFSNSMVEHSHKELKYQWLYHHTINSLQQLNQLLAQYLAEANERPRAVLYGLTPLEVLNGQVPEKHCHTPQLRKATENRKMENKKMKCCAFSF
jgi:putative transposase